MSTHAFKLPPEPVDPKRVKALREREKIVAKIFAKYKSTEAALLETFIGSLSCENCRSNKIAEVLPNARCKNHGIVSRAGKAGKHFCDLDGERLTFERQHSVSIDGIVTVVYLLRCEDCGMRFLKTCRFGLPGEPLAAMLRNWYRDSGL